MALVANSPNAWKLTVTLVDNGAKESTLLYALRAADHAAATTAAGLILAAIANVSAAVVKSYALSEVFVENALALPAGGVRVAEYANVTVVIDGFPNKVANLRIPAPLAGVFLAATGTNARIVDVTDADLQAYATMFGAAGPAFISDGEDLDVAADNGGIVRGGRNTRQTSTKVVVN